MRLIWSTLFKGLAAVLPVGLTVYLVYWLAVTIEGVLRPLIMALMPDRWYWPGMGLIAGMVLLFFIGLAVNAWLVRKLLQLGGDLVSRIPVVKSVYSSLRDFMEFFSVPQQRKDLQTVVMVNFGDARLIGFLTAENIQDLPGTSVSEETVAVYLPMSYQIGGYTAYLPRSRVEPLDITVEDAMRRVLTAGLGKRVVAGDA
jgi:uncharacterized membrane protein